MNIHIGVVNICGKRRKGRKPRLRWAIGPVSEQPVAGARSQTNMLQLTNTQQCRLAVSGQDRKGQPAALDNITYSSSDPSVVEVIQDTADPSKALAVAKAAGTAQVNVSADADLGDGQNILTGTLDITVVAGQAVGFTINTGTVEEQP